MRNKFAIPHTRDLHLQYFDEEIKEFIDLDSTEEVEADKYLKLRVVVSKPDKVHLSPSRSPVSENCSRSSTPIAELSQLSTPSRSSTPHADQETPSRSSTPADSSIDTDLPNLSTRNRKRLPMTPKTPLGRRPAQTG